MTSLWRLAGAGLAASLVVGAGGWMLERSRAGASDEVALARIEAELRQRFDASADTLGAMARQVASAREELPAVGRDPAAARRLFDAVDAALPDEEGGRTGITIYDARDAPVAWAGRVSDLPKDRIDGPTALFVAPGALGPRLIRIEPLLSDDRPPIRLGAIVVEQILGRVQGTPGLADTFVVSSSIAPVALRARLGDAARAPASPYIFVIPSRGGGPLVEAEVKPADLAEARARWRSTTWAAVVIVLALTLLLASERLITWRDRTKRSRVYVMATAALVAVLIVARAMPWLAATLVLGPRPLTSPIELLLTALTLAGIVWLGAGTVERCRYAPRRPRLLAPTIPAALGMALAYVATGLIVLWLIWSYEHALLTIVSRTSLDLLHFSLHPFSVTRLALAFGLVLLHAVVIWAAAIVARVPGMLWRTRRTTLFRLVPFAWPAGILVVLAVWRPLAGGVPTRPLLIALAATALCAAAFERVRDAGRRRSHAARIFVMFLAVLAPAMAMYPSMVAFATDAKERLVETTFGPQAASQREDLQLRRVPRALEQIDALPSLVDLVAGSGDETPTTDRAFVIWSKTELATYRLTSSVELYGEDGRLVSRFALNLPEYTTSRHRATSCDWELLEEISPFGSSERKVLRASRGICERGRIVGSIVVRAMLDYRTLPFISSESPYLESMRPDRQTLSEGISGRDVEFVVYGWSRTPIFESGTSVWELPDALFQRMVESRDKFWATLTRNGERFRVYFMNDRGGIYALGYPIVTWFGHLVNLAELAILAGTLYVLLLAGVSLFNTLTSHTPSGGRALWREVRSSFYGQLFLAFMLAAIAPVVILAVATRAYFATQLQAQIEQEAAKQATVAQRLVEDYATLQQNGPGALAAIDDQIMILVGRAINQDVNLFDGARLQATNQGDLFISGVLSRRTPGDVYRRILLDRLPTYVGAQEVGYFEPYLLAAAPVRAGGRERIVTVPQALRQQEIERQIDELDRRVLFGAVLFGLFGAGLGYWMAERIADPVNRLTRATRRIARGDLDARIAATTSSDELRRLVEDFNQMAADLKRQRAELERTQRLEAWADMARQVAHDIKNPLTPIQLSAEHLRRINLDRGQPLSPVLDDCVNAILAQVTLLRQISAEFSSFASSPTPRPEPTELPQLIEEVVEPYRAGLAGRIEIAVDAPADLPAITIDRTLFARALTNVIENALHAMPGGGRITIAARERPATTTDPRAIVVQVTDTGVGMDQDAIGKVFEPYFSTKATGTGLGLTIAKRNVELNGGTIAVDSERGVGTTVTITLPA